MNELGLLLTKECKTWDPGSVHNRSGIELYCRKVGVEGEVIGCGVHKSTDTGPIYREGQGAEEIDDFVVRTF